MHTTPHAEDDRDFNLDDNYDFRPPPVNLSDKNRTATQRLIDQSRRAISNPATSLYPANWPRCKCGRPVLDGHNTCGDVACGPERP